MSQGAPEDARWLAAAVPELPTGTRVLDAGCGTGAVGLALGRRQPGVRVLGVELVPEVAQEAREAGLEVWVGDLLTFQPVETFAAVVCNPPFHAVARGHTAKTVIKQLAHGLQPGQLAAWLGKFAEVSNPNARWWLVVHAACRDELKAYVQAQSWQALWAPLATHPVRPPKRALVQIGRGGGGAAWQDLPVVPGFDPALREAVLRRGEGLGIFDVAASG